MDSALKAFGEVNERTMKYQHICDDIYNRYVNGRQKRVLDDDELDQDLSEMPAIKIPKIEPSTLPTSTDNISNLISEIEKIKTEISE